MRNLCEPISNTEQTTWPSLTEITEPNSISMESDLLGLQNEDYLPMASFYNVSQMMYLVASRLGIVVPWREAASPMEAVLPLNASLADCRCFSCGRYVAIPHAVTTTECLESIPLFERRSDQRLCKWTVWTVKETVSAADTLQWERHRSAFHPSTLWWIKRRSFQSWEPSNGWLWRRKGIMKWWQYNSHTFDCGLFNKKKQTDRSDNVVRKTKISNMVIVLICTSITTIINQYCNFP